jgi:hypothetical protein
MASNNTNPAAGDRGAQIISGSKWSSDNSRIAEAAQLFFQGHAPIVRLVQQVGRRLIAEVRYTRDIQVPIVENDDQLEWGWQSIPVRPATDDDDFDAWEIFDDSKDYKTGWRRWHLVEGNA